MSGVTRIWFSLEARISISVTLCCFEVDSVDQVVQCGGDVKTPLNAYVRAILASGFRILLLFSGISRAQPYKR